MALWFLGIIGVGVVVWGGMMYMNPEDRAKREVLKYFEDLQAQYETDMYGGATPEETLQLFIVALEAGDIELASRYFLPDEREQIREYFQEIKVSDGWEKVLADSRNLKLTTKREDEAFYTISNQNKII